MLLKLLDDELIWYEPFHRCLVGLVAISIGSGNDSISG